MNAVAAFVLFVGAQGKRERWMGRGKKLNVFWGIAKIREISVFITCIADERVGGLEQCLLFFQAI